MSLSLPQWLARLEALHPREIDLGLDRIRDVAQRLPIRLPEKVITIAGTNGKGSCVAALDALCRDRGKKVGSYTSPHFLRYNERVRINGAMAADEDLVNAFEKIDAARGDISLTYFEFGTLAALLLFTAAELDYWILEVGLGGRLDAVNIVDADIAVLTSIDLDHQDWLGDDREKIGGEKAGIFRPGRIAICADRNPPSTVLRWDADSELMLAGRDFDWDKTGRVWWWRGRDAAGSPVHWDDLPLPSLPLASVVAAIQVAQCLGLEITAHQAAALLPALTLTGRCQRIDYRGKRLLLDVAHNPAAAAHLAPKLAEPGERVIAVFAVMADKDYRGIFAALSGSVALWLTGNLPGNSRAATAAELDACRRDLGLAGEDCATVAACLERAVDLAGPDDLIMVLGSFYTVAEVLSIVGREHCS